ncbi:hypothetical protein FRC10_000633 [Ceratobasidium sp. 414]|nr:hypothetical protein FRC10_000633 [Ceratobasidium sp. 414]
MSAAAIRAVKVDPARTAFFICDLQERIRGVIWKFDDIVYTAGKMLRMAKVLDVPVLTTEQHPKDGNVFKNQASVFPLDLVQKLKQSSRFSMITNEVEEAIQQHRLNGVVLMGIESQICITQTAIDLLQRGIDVHVLADGVSSCNKEEIPWALARMRQAGAQITTSESILYQLIGDASGPSFRAFGVAMKEEREKSKQVLASLLGEGSGTWPVA